MEEWKDIKGYEDFYQASTHGNIKSKDRLVTRANGSYIKKGRILLCHGTQYKLATLTDKDGNVKKETVHRIIAETFLQNPENLPCVNHINGVKKDNRVENLEWCTYSDNILHSFEMGLSKIKSGEDNHKSKLKNQDILRIVRMYSEGNYVDEIARYFKVSAAHISRILRGVDRTSESKLSPNEITFLRYKSQESRKFSKEEVHTLLNEYYKNKMKPKDIQRKYEITSGTLFDIVKGRTYKDYTEKYLKELGITK